MIQDIHDPAVLRLLAGLTQNTAAKYCGLSKRTIARYERKGAPIWYLHLMRYRSGYLPGWDGFRFEPGQVWTPANQLVLASEVEHYRWLVVEIGHSKRCQQFKSKDRIRLASVV